VLFDASKCCGEANRFRAYCCPIPTNLEPPKPSAEPLCGTYFYFVFNYLARPHAVVTTGWHGARTIDQRADAQNFLTQLNNLTLFGELTC